MEKLRLSWLVPYFARKIYVQNKHKGNKAQTKSIKPKLLKTLNINQFQASPPSDFIYRAGTYN